MHPGWLRWLVIPIVVVPLAWLLFAGLGRDPREIPSPLVGKALPAIEATTLQGDAWSSVDLAAKPAVINFWASYCIPSCADEHPFLLGLQAHHGADLALIGVLYQDTPDGARGFLARYGDGGWPTLLDPSGRIAVDLGVTGPPETFFVDAHGVVRARYVGPLNAESLAAGLASIGIAA
ncbi:MAG: redoxin family protein [Chloroflexota bacterium]|nr:redoxin family protein [Chloroflexota bacterium]